MAVIYDILAPLRKFVKPKTFQTDSILFLFFYRATVGIHVLFCLMLAGRAYFGNPISCAVRRAEVRPDLVDQYCWATGTWTVGDKEPDEITTRSVQRKVRSIHDVISNNGSFYIKISVISNITLFSCDIIGMEHTSKRWNLR